MSFFDQIKVYKKVLPSHKFHEMCDHVAFGNWTINISSQNYQSHKLFWGSGLTKNPFFHEYVFGQIKQLIGDDYQIEEILGNAQSALQPASPHMDNVSPNAYTFILYANKKWDYTWGGQTIFFNKYWDSKTNSPKIAHEEEDEVKCIFPLPNVGVFFPGNIVHYAEAPTRDFYGVRYSVAFKLSKK